MRAILNKTLPRATARLQRKHPPTPKKKPVQVASNLKFPTKAAASAVPERVEKKPALRPVTQAAPETVASLPPEAEIKTQTTPAGGFHIQVGAYSRHTDAMERLAAIQVEAGDVIGGHAPLAVPLNEPRRNLYRARFAGFSRNSADSTCSQLKRRAITCVVMSAE